MLACTVISRPPAPGWQALRSSGRRRAQTRKPSLARAPTLASAESGKQPKAAHAAAENATSVLVQFRVQRRVPFGQELLVVGDAEALGSWDCGQAVLMKWHEGDVWEAHVELPANLAVEFKFVQQVPNSAPVWESCLNRTLAVAATALDVDAVWSAPLSTVYHDHAISATAAEAEAEAGLSEDDVPPPFRASEALAKFTEVVQASLDAISSGGSAGSSNGSASFDAAAPAAVAATSTGTGAPAPAESGGATSDPLAAAAAGQPTAQNKKAAAAPGSTQQGAQHALAAAVAQDVPAADQPAVVAASAAAGQDSKAAAAEPGVPAVPAVAAEASQAAAAAAKTAGDASKAAEDAGSKGGKGSTVVLPAQAEAAVGEIIDAAAAADAPAPSPTAPKSGGSGGGPSLKALTQVAGTVALGVAAAGVMGALAIDITDAAVLGAVTAGAAAALSTPSASGKRSVSRRKSKAAGTSGAARDTESELSAGEEVGEPAATIASKPSAPGVILAAGVLSAIDAGKKILADSPEASKPAGGSNASGAEGKAEGKPRK